MIIMEIAIDDVHAGSFIEKKKKCLTNSEYNAMAMQIDSLINDNDEFILNKFDLLNCQVLSEYPHIHPDTVLSIIDARVQFYVRQRYYKVFNNTSSNNSSHSSSTIQNSITSTPNKSPSHYQQKRNRPSINSTLYERYKELAANGSVKSPLVTLANNLRMPAMLVAKVVLTDQIQEEKLKEQLHQQLEDSFNNSLLNESSSTLNDSNLTNESYTEVKQNSWANVSEATTELDNSLSNVDIQLSKQLTWLTKKLLSMKKAIPEEVLDQSANSSTNSNNSHCVPKITKSLSLTPHQLASSTWLIRKNPQLAYQVFKCSVIDSHYGPCVEFIKTCTGKRYEEFLKRNMSSVTTDIKSQINQSDKNSMYITEKECRIRGLDMTPDMVLNEPIAILLNNDSKEDYQEFTATSYVGGNDNGIRVLNWIESKAMFGGPEQMRVAMQRQLFPYWNRYGTGAVIYWFGHLIEDSKTSLDVPTNKPTIDSASTANIKLLKRVDLTESSEFNFWSKYCLLLDGFPASSRIVMHRNQNRQISKKKI